MSEIININNIHKYFGDHKVLSGIHFDVHEGETLVIMGGSGCGKSTLLRTLIGLLQPDDGEIRIFGRSMTHATEAARNET